MNPINIKIKKTIPLCLSLMICLTYEISGQIPVKSNEEIPVEDIIEYNLSVLQKDPQNLNASISLVESYYRINDYKKSILYANISEDILLDLQAAGNPYKDHNSYLFYIFQTRGKSRHKLGMYRKALKEYIAAVTLNRTDSDLLIDIGNLYYNQADYDSAMYFFRLADNFDSLSFKSKFNIANVYYVKKSYDSALYYYDKSIKINPNFPYAYFYKGTIYNEIEFLKQV